ncbi:MAG: hypothetical protein V3U71_13425 [Cocleimonas sp.]
MKKLLADTVKQNSLLLVICSITVGLAMVSSYAKNEDESGIQLVEQSIDINTNFVFLEDVDHLASNRLFITNSSDTSFGRN